ncbi:MAG: glycosyltransferase [Desulfomonilaceae bacterium]
MAIPVILFTYNRPQHLVRTLDSLRANQVPLIYAFSDGPKGSQDAAKVNEVRKILRSIDWCKVKLTEREANLGLGRSILTGVTAVLRKHDAIIVIEDDLICISGTYAYLCAALEHFRDVFRVMSVTGFSHPMITPPDVTDLPHFSGHFECLVWGTWARAWQGMVQC